MVTSGLARLPIAVGSPARGLCQPAPRPRLAYDVAPCRSRPWRAGHARQASRHELWDRPDGQGPCWPVCRRSDDGAAHRRAPTLPTSQRAGAARDRGNRLPDGRRAFLAGSPHAASGSAARAGSGKHSRNSRCLLLRGESQPTDLLLPVGLPLLRILLYHEGDGPSDSLCRCRVRRALDRTATASWNPGVVDCRDGYARCRRLPDSLDARASGVTDREALRRGALRPIDKPVQPARLP